MIRIVHTGNEHYQVTQRTDFRIDGIFVPPTGIASSAHNCGFRKEHYAIKER